MSAPLKEEFVSATLEAWGDTVVAMLADKLKARKLVLTGELLRSLEFEVRGAAAGSTAKLFLAFEESGRIRDMRAVTQGKMPPVHVMEEFVAKRGLTAFKHVPGYEAARKLPTESMAINRIAWGISRSIKKRNGAKPKKWFARPFYGMINVLIDDLLTKYQDFAANTITDK